jgi:hypothetical protein
MAADLPEGRNLSDTPKILRKARTATVLIAEEVRIRRFKWSRDFRRRLISGPAAKLNPMPPLSPLTLSFCVMKRVLFHYPLARAFAANICSGAHSERSGCVPGSRSSGSNSSR